MSNLSAMELAFAVYLALVFAKTMLCYSGMHTALGVMIRLRGANHCLFWAMVLLIAIPLVCFVATPVLLLSERLAFFIAYPKFRVIRELAVLR